MTCNTVDGLSGTWLPAEKIIFLAKKTLEIIQTDRKEKKNVFWKEECNKHNLYKAEKYNRISKSTFRRLFWPDDKLKELSRPLSVDEFKENIDEILDKKYPKIDGVRGYDYHHFYNRLDAIDKYANVNEKICKQLIYLAQEKQWGEIFITSSDYDHFLKE